MAQKNQWRKHLLPWSEGQRRHDDGEFVELLFHGKAVSELMRQGGTHLKLRLKKEDIGNVVFLNSNEYGEDVESWVLDLGQPPPPPTTSGHPACP